MGVGRATGVFERIASDINYFYQLGVESRPSDGDGKTHRVEVKVSRAKRDGPRAGGNRRAASNAGRIFR